MKAARSKSEDWRDKSLGEGGVGSVMGGRVLPLPNVELANNKLGAPWPFPSWPQKGKAVSAFGIGWTPTSRRLEGSWRNKQCTASPWGLRFHQALCHQMTAHPSASNQPMTIQQKQVRPLSQIKQTQHHTPVLHCTAPHKCSTCCSPLTAPTSHPRPPTHPTH